MKAAQIIEPNAPLKINDIEISKPNGNQVLDKEGRIRYSGSTVQQNHGETNDKGLLIWEIDSKDEWEIEPHVFKNPKPFFTIPLTLKGRMPRNLQVPQGARLRLVSNNNLRGENCDTS